MIANVQIVRGAKLRLKFQDLSSAVAYRIIYDPINGIVLVQEDSNASEPIKTLGWGIFSEGSFTWSGSAQLRFEIECQIAAALDNPEHYRAFWS